MGLMTILTYIVLIFFIYVDVCFFHLPLHVLFLFSLYAHASYYVYAIYYLCFTQRCLDEFYLKYFRNTGCQSLFAINSLLAKFFKRNTYSCKGEMCFILLGGKLTSFFLYTGLVTMFTYIVLIFDIYI